MRTPCLSLIETVLMKKIYFLGLISLLFLGAMSAPVWGKANFTVAPGIVEFDISRPSTKTFLIVNSGDENIRLFIRPIYFKIDSRSLAAGTHLHSRTASIENIATSIMASPRVLSLTPGQRRNVRISVRPRKKLAPGDYRAHLLIKTLGKQKPKAGAGEDGAPGMSINLEINLETAVAIYGRVGKPDYMFKWECKPLASGKLIVEATNLSKWRFSGWIGVFDTSKPETPLAATRLVSLRESKRPVAFDIAAKANLEIRWGKNQGDLSQGRSQCPIIK